MQLAAHHYLQQLIAFTTAVIITTIAASIGHSIGILVDLQSVGAEIPFQLWLHTCWHDLLALNLSGLVGTPFPLVLLIAIGLFIALTVATGLHHMTLWPKRILYPLAGATCLITIKQSIELFAGFNLLIGTASMLGLSLFILAGAVGGYSFHRLTARLGHSPSAKNRNQGAS